MTVALDVRAVPAGDRAEAIRDLIWSAVVRVEIQHQPDPDRIYADGRISDLGQLNVCSIRANATRVDRTEKLARDPVDPFVFVGLQVAGSSVVVQHGREAVLAPGDLAIYDTRRPYTLVNDHGIHQHFFRVPVAALELPGSVLEAVTAVRLDGSRPLAEVTASHLRRLAETAERLAAVDGERVAEPTISLLRALIGSQVAETPATRDLLDRSLEARIVEFIRSHLTEPDLSAARIAAHHHISVRHLYRVLGASGIALGDWVRDRRLELCRQALADPTDPRTIAAIAHGAGFCDVTNFGRAFKSSFGETPRAWRLRSRHNG
jgi:AraC-like DNA-binding protein